MDFDDIIRISEERKIEMRTAASIMAIGRVSVAELSREIANIVTNADTLSEDSLNAVRNYLTYLRDDLMTRIPLDYWTLVILITNMEKVLNAHNISDGSIIEIIKEIYTEAIFLFSSFVKAKPDNDDLLMAVAALPEEARKVL